MAARGRPKTRPVPRREQLRRAKRAQRERERARGLVSVQLRLPRATADKLAAARRDPRFVEQLDELLEQAVVRVADHPALSDIAWSVTARYLPARTAFALYERNWRFVDPARLTDRERALIERLAARFGHGIIHA
jgi:hypothetical protein